MSFLTFGSPYSSPFSTIGVHFSPLGIVPEHSGILLHEAGFLRRNITWNFPRVLSPFWRCYYNLKHGHRLIFPNKEFDLGPEAVAIIPDHQLFHCKGGPAPVPHLWIAFNVARRLNPQQSIPILIRLGSIEKELLKRLRILLEARDANAHKHQILHLSMALLHILLNHKELAWERKPLPKIQLLAQQIIESDFSKPLRIPEIAQTIGVSLRSLSKSFKEHRGVTPAYFLIQTRVKEAASRLSHTEMTIDDISDATGFPNRYYFSRVFKKITGMSPAYFRRTHLNR